MTKEVALSFLALALTQASLAQVEKFDEEWRWSHFTTESGLPSNQVFAVAETPDSIVWAATSGGLAWFDGFRWHSLPDTPAFYKRRATALVPNTDGSLFVIFGHTLHRCTKEGLTPIPVLIDTADVGILTIMPVSDLGFLVQGGDTKLYLFKDNTFRQFAVPSSPAFRGGMPSLHSSGRKQGAWLSTGDGLYKWTASGWQQRFQEAPEPPDISGVVELNDGSAFVSMGGGQAQLGIWRSDPDGSSRHILSEGGGHIRSMDAAPKGDIIAVHESNDIRIYNKGEWRSLTPIPPQLQGTIFVRYRSNGDLWVGTERGLYHNRDTSRRWTYCGHAFPGVGNHVSEIIRTRDGAIWLGTLNGIEIHRPDGSVTEIERINGKRISLITGLCEDKDGNVWASSGHDFEGAYRWDGKSWRYFGANEGLHGIMHRIRNDRQGRLWFLGIGATAYGPQPGAYSYKDGVFTHWSRQNGLLHDRVYICEQSNDGALWFGTKGGLSRLKSGRWTHWRSAQERFIDASPTIAADSNNRFGQELSMGAVFTIAIDSNNRVWFGDRGNGLGYIDEKDRPQYMKEADGLVQNQVWDIKPDNRGTLWVATSGGISRYHDGTWSTFSLSTGLNNLKIWPILPIDDKVYAGTDGNGVNILSLDEPSHPRPIVVCDEPATEGTRALIRWKCLAYWGEIPFDAIESRYRLDDNPWSQWSVRGEGRFSGLPAGDHRIQIQAKDLFGNFDSPGEYLAFTIVPPFYTRPSFTVPIGLLSSAVLFLGIALLVRKRNHMAAIRESEAKLRMITETTASAMFIMQDSKFRFVNPVMETLTGFAQHELERFGLNEIAVPVHRDHLKQLREIAENPDSSPARIEIQVVRKDGEPRWVDCSLRRIPYEGKPAILGTAFDITDRKNVEGKLLDYQEQLRSLASELSFTEERERRRMAAYLHDSIAQALAFAKIKLESFMDTTDPSAHDGALTEIHKFISQSIENTQSLTFELSPPVLNELGFEEAVDWLCGQMREQHHISIAFQNDTHPKPMGDDICLVLFNAVRELLVNAAKHARAREVTVAISRNGGSVGVIVEDNGIGFDLKKMTARDDKKGGFGLFNIRERLTRMGGELNITTRPGGGTRIVLKAPLGPSTGNPHG